MTEDRSGEVAGSPRAHEAVAALSQAVERGHHLALVAAEGAGVESLYAAAAIRDLEAEADGGRAFVLTASVDRARRCARAMYPTTSRAGLHLLVVTPSTTPLGEDADGARVLVGPPALLLEEVRAGRLSAADLRTLALDDVRALRPAWPAVEAILQAGDPDGRRLATTHERDETFDALLKHWLPRARRWPSELFAETPPGGTRGAPPLEVGSAATWSGRVDRLTDLLHELARVGKVESVSVHTGPSTVAEVRAALEVAGFRLSEVGAAEGVRVGPWDALAPAGTALLLELPPSAESLSAALGGARRRIAIVDSLHEPQLGLMATRLGWRVAPLAQPLERPLLDDVEAFRVRVADGLVRHDLASGMLLLAPLLEEHGATRVAAALASLLRESGRATTDSGSWDGPRGAGLGAVGTDRAAERVTRPTWTRVFVGIGKRDGAGPGDLLGAITGETSVAGGQIGRIDVRPGFSLVDVDSLVADQVVRGLDGSRIKGRQVVARLDREQRR